MAYIGLEAEEYDRKYSDKELIKRIFNYFRIYKRQMVIVSITVTISSLVSGLVPILSSIALNMLTSDRNILNIILLLFFILVFNLLSYVFNYFNWTYSARAVGNVLLDLRDDAVKAVLEHDLSFFDKNPIGKIVSRINSDSYDFGSMVDLANQVISSIFTLGILLLFMAFINLMLFFAFTLAIPIFFILAFFFRKMARKKTLQGQRALATVNEMVKETLSGIQIAKTFRQEAKLYDKFNEINTQSYKVNLRRAWVLNAIFPSLGIAEGIVLTLIIYFGGLAVLNGQIQAGDLFLFLQTLWILLFPLFVIAAFWPQFQAGLASAERIFALIDATSVVVQKDNLKPPKFKGKIEFKNLTFQYEEGKKVLENFNLTIKPGESIAIVGHTGAGKSTIAKLIARFYEFQEGDILIDDISIRNFNLKEYRKQIGIISQTPFLWADTIENNVKYCCNLADKDAVMSALELAGGSDWVQDTPKGLDTYIRERGNLLSMGQRQLLVFARTLLEDPSILILDEATASVDPFTETRIQDALDKTIRNRTSIIIAHRLWTVRHVDRIIVLEQGKIVEEGNHNDLMAKGGKYASLYNTYFRHQSLEYIEKMKEIVQKSV
jgi:ABC-type multidrug transport system fused ATPase/permease subunit